MKNQVGLVSDLYYYPFLSGDQRRMNTENLLRSTPEISFTIIYSDEDLLQVGIKASNGRFSGTTTFFASSDGNDFVDFSKKLCQFPIEVGQTVNQNFGLVQKEFIKEKREHFDIKSELSHVELNFRYLNRNTYPVVDIILLEEDWAAREEARGKVSLEMPFVPDALDLFIQELQTMGVKKAGSATLIGIRDREVMR
jgi:hypothetical protein